MRTIVLILIAASIGACASRPLTRGEQATLQRSAPPTGLFR
ncbi:MAG: hypothetical protein ABW275_09180 [Hansschlegelia sp.]